MFAARQLTAPAVAPGGRPVRRNVRACVTADRAALDITKMAPLGDRILVQTVNVAEVSEGGILMTGVVSSSAQAAQIGEVLAVGEGLDVDVKQGDTILYSKYGTSDIEVSKGRVVFVSKDSVLGVCV